MLVLLRGVPSTLEVYSMQTAPVDASKIKWRPAMKPKWWPPIGSLRLANSWQSCWLSPRPPFDLAMHGMARISTISMPGWGGGVRGGCQTSDLFQRHRHLFCDNYRHSGTFKCGRPQVMRKTRTAERARSQTPDKDHQERLGPINHCGTCRTLQDPVDDHRPSQRSRTAPQTPKNDRQPRLSAVINTKIL